MAAAQFHRDAASAYRLRAAAFVATSTSKEKAGLLALANAHDAEAARLEAAAAPPVVVPGPVPPSPPASSTLIYGRDITAAVVGPGAGWAPKTVHTTFQTINGDDLVITDTLFAAGCRINGSGTKFVRCRGHQPDVQQAWVFGNYGRRTRFEWCDIDGQEKVNAAIKSDAGGDALTIHRSHMHHVGHGLNAYSPGKAGPTWLMTESLIDDIVAPIPVPNKTDDPWHSDCILSNSPNSWAEGTKALLKLGQTNVINHGTAKNEPAISGLRYKRNYYAGGGYTIAHEARGGDVTDYGHEDCDFGLDFFQEVGAWGIFYPSARPTSNPILTGSKVVPAGTPVTW